MRTLRLALILSLVSSSSCLAGVDFSDTLKPFADGSRIADWVPAQARPGIESAMRNIGYFYDIGNNVGPDAYYWQRAYTGLGLSPSYSESAALQEIQAALQNTPSSMARFVNNLTGNLPEASINAYESTSQDFGIFIGRGPASQLVKPLTDIAATAADEYAMIPAGEVGKIDSVLFGVSNTGNVVTKAYALVDLYGSLLKPGATLPPSETGGAAYNELKNMLAQATYSGKTMTNYNYIQSQLSQILEKYGLPNMRYNGSPGNYLITADEEGYRLLKYIETVTANPDEERTAAALTKIAYNSAPLAGALSTMAASVSQYLSGVGATLAGALTAGTITPAAIALGWVVLPLATNDELKQLHQQGLDSGCGNDIYCAMATWGTKLKGKDYYAINPVIPQYLCSSWNSCVFVTPRAGPDTNAITDNNDVADRTDVPITADAIAGPSQQGITPVYTIGTNGDLPQGVQMNYDQNGLPTHIECSTPPCAFTVSLTYDYATGSDSIQSQELPRDSSGGYTDQMGDNVPGYGGDGNGGDYGTGGGCFTAGTGIETPQGEVAIEKVKVGDQVYAYDTTAQKTVVGVVAKTFVHTNKAYGHVGLADGTTLEVTPIHPFFDVKTKSWIAIGKFKIGDKVLRGRNENAHEVAITSLDFSDAARKATVYNIHVKQYKDYYAKDILVHNKDELQPIEDWLGDE